LIDAEWKDFAIAKAYHEIIKKRLEQFQSFWFINV